MFRDYRYKVEFSRHAVVKQKVTDISWQELVNVIAKNSLHQVKAIRFHHVGSPNGTAHLDGGTMLTLWKQVQSQIAKTT
jgi:hypothetical protein